MPSDGALSRCPVRGLMRALSVREGASAPHRAYAKLRDAGRVHAIPYFGAAFAHYKDVRDILFDRALTVSSASAKPGSARARVAQNLPPDLQALPAPLFFQDGEAHKRLRKHLAAHFNLQAVKARRPAIEQAASDLLDTLQHEAEFDLIARYAAPLPLYVIGDILGVPHDHRAAFRRQSEAIVNELHPLASADQRAEAVSSHRDLVVFFRSQIAERRFVARGDLISALVDAERRGELSEDEIVSLCVNLLVAGHITTSDLISTLAHLLLSHPDQLERLRAEPQFWGSAIHEALRCEPPTPLLARVECKDAARHGHSFEVGDNLNLFIAAANRDPDVFDDPDRFDVRRANNVHLSFGGGDHFCLGAQLACAEAEIAVRRLFERIPKLQLGASAWRKNVNFRGLETLSVRNRAHASFGTQRQGEFAH